jgi:hypothetical protein
MKKQVEEIIINRKDETGNVVDTNIMHTILLFPEEGKAIRNKLTGDIIKGYVGLGTNDSEHNYEDYELKE